MAEAEKAIHANEDAISQNTIPSATHDDPETAASEGQIAENGISVCDKSLAFPPAPDGGFQAWFQVLAAHLVVFNAWGYINSFGIFQSYYVATLGMPASTVSWIGSFQVFLIFFIGTFSGRALDAGYYREIAAAGAFLQLLGVFMTSLCTEYWQLFLAQGVCQGIGDGLIFCPTVGLTATWFSSRRTLAVATSASGAATGGIVFPLIAQQLLTRIGFGWTIRVMGLVILVNYFVIFSIAKTRLPPRKSGPLFELSAFKELPYLLFAIGMWFVLWGTYFGYYYVRAYAVNVLNAPESMSFNYILILNAVGLPGRVVPAYLADRYFSPLMCLIPSAFAGALCLFTWFTVPSTSGYYVWVVFFGWFGATIQGLFPGSLASLTADPSKTGTRIGMVFSIVSVACLTGPPLAGKLIQVAGGSYVAAAIWGGTSLVVGTAILAAGWVAKRKK